MGETVAAAAARALAGAGIERVFGLPGGEVLVLMDELRRAGVDFVLMRHEANAGIAAAVRLLIERNRVVAEGAGAAAVAAALQGVEGARTVVCVVSGGNIDTARLLRILQGEVP